MTTTLALVASLLFAVGVYLVLQRSLTRIIVGVALLGHGANLVLLLAGGGAGQAPVLGHHEEEAAALVSAATPGGVADPVPQALALTAIVISFGVTAFLLTLAYRSYALTRSDQVENDIEDRRIAAGADVA